MIQPKSLTATIHVRFHYAEDETRPVTDCPIDLVANLLEHVGDLSPDLQELVVKFANYLREHPTVENSR